MKNAHPITVKLSIYFEGVNSMGPSAIDEVRDALLEALRGSCKPAFEEALKKIDATDIHIQFIAY